MKPRVTLNLRFDGELEIWLNEAGRDLLIRELQSLDQRNENFNLMPKDWGGGDIEVSLKSYRETDKIIESGKVLLRTDEWDRAHFPHVMFD